ncbi:MAG: hypothetical protein CVT63_05935, partial [Candidatus Anoxymicrobium japonicum]
APFHKYSQANAAASAPAAFRFLAVLTEYDSVARSFKERRIDALDTLPYLWKGALSDVAFLNLEEDIELVLWIESLPPAAALVHACAPFLPRGIFPPLPGSVFKGGKQ